VRVWTFRAPLAGWSTKPLAAAGAARLRHPPVDAGKAHAQAAHAPADL